MKEKLVSESYPEVGFEVLTMVVMKRSAIWDVIPSCLLKINPEDGGDMFL
jgi:hypothetical protein